MPDLDAVYDELSPAGWPATRAAFRATDNPTDANAARVAQGPEPRLTAAPTPLPTAARRADRKYPDGQMFAGVRKGKRYVSYHLFTSTSNQDSSTASAPSCASACKARPASTSPGSTPTSSTSSTQLTDRGRDLYAERGLLAHG